MSTPTVDSGLKKNGSPFVIHTSKSLLILGLYALIIFLSAFLLFQIQPIISKFILPWFGGSASVWTTSMLFFQFFLFLGYSYAHFLTTSCTFRQQGCVHLILLACSLFLLPVTPDNSWRLNDLGSAEIKILLLLLVSIGGPYFLLASTGPLLQRWIYHARPHKSPYRLYALSNIGSLLGLLIYPVLVEPSISLRQQTFYWSLLYGLFVFSCGLCSLFISFIPTAENSTHLSAIPFLWVLPLSIYLISFIICFDNARWYERWIWISLFLFSLLASVLLIYFGRLLDITSQLFLYSIVLFSSCMVAHGELARLKPAAENLTIFYLAVA